MERNVCHRCGSDKFAPEYGGVYWEKTTEDLGIAWGSAYLEAKPLCHDCINTLEKWFFKEKSVDTRQEAINQIINAMYAVEAIGCHPDLTEVVVLLMDAKRKLQESRHEA